MMTRKNFEAIAQTINDQKGYRVVDLNDALFDVANALTHVFKADNPNFDSQRFLDACGFSL